MVCEIAEGRAIEKQKPHIYQIYRKIQKYRLAKFQAKPEPMPMIFARTGGTANNSMAVLNAARLMLTATALATYTIAIAVSRVRCARAKTKSTER